MKQTAIQLDSKLSSLTIFRNLLQTPVVDALRKYFYSLITVDAKEFSESNQVSCYCEFVSELYKVTPNLSKYLFNLVMEDENVYMHTKAMKKAVNPIMKMSLTNELAIIKELAEISSEDMKSLCRYKGFLPDYDITDGMDFEKEYAKRLESINACGYGIYAKYSVFTVNDGCLVPVRHPDSQKLSELSGYERERNLVIKNTEALLRGDTASNILLYGDAGTGKSSTVKAVARHFKEQGLRLIEFKKNQLYQLPEIIEELSSNPLKFIIFIDDLSFTSNDDNFSALKAILEGSVSSCGSNIVIYATSNRRHLVKETMADRDGDELFVNDTLQETMSLAARFGLAITFQRPDKDEYLEIVKHIAKEYGLDMPEDELITKAEAHAIRANGRSPRTAKQFVELQKTVF